MKKVIRYKVISIEVMLMKVWVRCVVCLVIGMFGGRLFGGGGGGGGVLVGVSVDIVLVCCCKFVIS